MKRMLILLLAVLLLPACEPAPVDNAALIADLEETISALEAQEPETVEVTREVAVANTPAPTATPLAVEVTRVVTETVPPAPPGSGDRPVALIFAPTFDNQITAFRGEALAEALRVALDLNVTLQTPGTYAETIEAVCAAPDTAVAFMPAAIYQLAAARCGAQAELLSERFEIGWEASMLVVRTDSNIFNREALSGARWAVDSRDSLTNSIYFEALFAAAGIEVGEVIETGSDSSSMLALLNGEADFATASFVPPLLPRLERRWTYGIDSPEIWRVLGIPPTRHPRGFTIVLALPEDGGYRIRDARAAVFDVQPDVFNLTRINELSAQLPNDVAVLGAGMPLGTARAITDFLDDYAASEACLESICSGDFLNWTGFESVTPDSFDALDFMTETLELSPEFILGLYDQ